MNKKFFSAILFGALTAASTSTFVSCKDYDDDIQELQEQINQNASTAASELAAKVASLESQISKLNAAREDLASQLAAAKSEAAVAAANALAAAQAAQTAADAAKAGGDAAAATAAAAKETADKAIAEITATVARVATLETKITNLESIVADLNASKAELNTKVSDLQTQMTAVKADTKANADAIAAANAAILAKATELSGEIAKVSSALGARIDVVDATLNSIQANYATKDELNTKANELAAMDAQLNNQIAVNSKFIETLQATVKDLAAKDAELAGKIESNYNALLDKINAMNVEQANMLKTIEALQAASSELKAQYSALSSAKADLTYVDNINNQLTTLINSLQKTLNDLTASDASQAQTINTLLQDVSGLKDKTKDLQDLVAKNAQASDKALQDAIAQLQSEMREAGVASDAALGKAVNDIKALVEENAAEIAAIKEDLAKKADQTEVDALAESLTFTQADVMNITLGLNELKGDIAAQEAELLSKIADAEAAAKEYAQEAVNGLDARLVDAEELLAQLVAIGGEDLSKFITEDELAEELSYYITNEEFAVQFAAQKQEIADKFQALNDAYTAFEAEIQGKIEEELAKLEKVNEDLVALKSAVDVLENQVEALIKRIQSVVFIPQYRDAESTVIVPTYNYAPTAYKTENDRNGTKSVLPHVVMKFRVQPSEAADILVSTFKKADANNYMKLYVEKALETRAANQNIATIEAIEKDAEAGVINVTAVVNGVRNDEYRPTTLVIGSDLYNTEVTSESGETTKQNVSSADVKLRITTEYFNLKGIEYSTIADELLPESGVAVDANGLYEIPYTDIAVTHTPWTEAYVAINDLRVNYVNWGYNTNLKVWAGIDANGQEYKISDNNKWNTFKNTSKADGFVVNNDGSFYMDKTTPGGSAKVANVGNQMTLCLMDDTFGFDSNGRPNKPYYITYIIVKPTADDDYNFGNFARVWSAADANNNGTTDGSEAFTALSKDDRNAATPQFSEGTLAIGKYIVKNVVAATEQELAEELDRAIDAGDVVYTINGAAPTNDVVTLSIDTRNKKADLTVDFGAATKYETKNIVAVVTTVYGDVTFKATANLSYPTDFLVHEPRWTDGRFNVEAGNQVVSYRDGLVGSSLPAGYTNYADYVETGVVEYVFEQILHTWIENNSRYTPNNVSYAAEYGADYYLKLTGTPAAGTSNDATDNVKMKVTVIVDGHEVTGEEFNLNVKYPLEGMEVTSDEQTIPAATLINNQTVSVIQNVTLNDRYGNKLFKDGVIVSRTGTPNTNAGVWGITGLTYKLNNAVSASGKAVSTVSVSNDGKVSIVDPNISEDIIVNIDVETVGYYYNAVKGNFNVIIKATY